MNDSHEKDRLWELLGRGARPSVSPFFARNVLRAIRQAPADSGWFAIPRWAAAASFAVLVAGFAVALPGGFGESLPVLAEEEAISLFDRLAGIHDLSGIKPIGLEEFAGL